MPKVNLQFLNNFTKQRKGEELNSLINIGLTHGLHTIHGSLKIRKFLLDSLCKQATFENISEIVR